MSGPFLLTERLELWQPRPGDLPGLLDLTMDEESRRFLGNLLPSETDSFARLLRNAASWSLWGYGTFMVRLKGQGRIIGNCGIFHSHRGFGPAQGMDGVAEAGWIIHRDHWGQGIAAEAMEAALAWFDAAHGPQRIACMIEQGHTASERVAQRLGFVRYGQQESKQGQPLILYERSPDAPGPG